MDITLFIFLTLIGLFFFVYGWEKDGISFIFLFLSVFIFLPLTFESFSISWYFNSNSTVTTYPVASREFTILFSILSMMAFLLTYIKIAIFVEENYNKKILNLGWLKK
jgi:hypothetical protein